MIGFIYLWHDSGRSSKSCPGRRRWCLGSHCGTEDDGYVTSTGGNYFRSAYHKRPQDFKRRIIERIYAGNGRTVLDAEQRWLNLIKSEELGQRYYNRKKNAAGLSREDVLRLLSADPTIVKRQGQAVREAYASNPALGRKMSVAVRAAHAADPTLGKRIGQAVKTAYASNPMLGQRLAQIMREVRAADPEFGSRLGQAIRDAYVADPMLKKRIGEAVRDAYTRITPEQREIWKQHIREGLLASFAADPTRSARISQILYDVHANDPTLRQRISAGVRDSYVTDPTLSSRKAQTLRDTYAKDSTLRQRVSDGARDAHARKTPEQRRECALKSWVTRRKNAEVNVCPV